MSSKKTSNKLPRRMFLKKAMTTGLISPALYKAILLNVVSNSLDKAYGSVQSGNTLTSLYFDGGLLLSTWIQALQTSSGEDAQLLQQHPAACNKLANANNPNSYFYDSVSAGSYMHPGTFVPHMWAANAATPTGVKLMMTLLQNACFFRSFVVPSSNHNQATQFVINPDPGGLSINNILGHDKRASSPFTNIRYNLDAAYSLKTEQGPAIDLASLGGGNNRIAHILAPFTTSFTPKVLANNDPNQLIDGLFEQFKTKFQIMGGKSQNFFDEKQNAKNMFARVQQGFNYDWNTLLAKYENLILSNSQIHIPGVTDQPIMADGSDLFHIKQGSGNIINANNENIVASINASDNNFKIAQQFAFMEFILGEGLTNSLFMGFNGPSIPSSQYDNIGFDSHSMGGMFHLVYIQKYLHHFTSCLMELKDRLIDKNVWHKNFILAFSEFGRPLRRDLFGTDHNGDAGSAALFSGAITQGRVVGNCYRPYYDGPGNNDSLRIGEAAPQANGHTPTIGNIHATVAEICGGKNNAPRESSLASLDSNGRIVTNMETRNITKT